MEQEKTLDQILAEFEAQKQENKWAYDQLEEKKCGEGSQKQQLKEKQGQTRWLED